MAGRKSKYDECVKPYLKQIGIWVEQGATKQQIAKQLTVAYSTFREYEKQYPALVAALKKSIILIGKLRGALVKRALGYSYTETKVIKERNDLPKEMVDALIDAGFSKLEITETIIRRTETHTKEMPPDVAALNLALKNYDKENWANDPQMLNIRKKELELRKKQMENNNW